MPLTNPRFTLPNYAAITGWGVVSVVLLAAYLSFPDTEPVFKGLVGSAFLYVALLGLGLYLRW